jgi:hypothetical protein
LVGGSKCSKMLVQMGGVDERWQEGRKKIAKNVRDELYLGREWQEQRGRVFHLRGEIASGRVRAGRASEPKVGKYERLKNGYRTHCVSTAQLVKH